MVRTRKQEQEGSEKEELRKIKKDTKREERTIIFFSSFFSLFSSTFACLTSHSFSSSLESLQKEFYRHIFLNFKMWLYSAWPVQKEFFGVLFAHISAAPQVQRGQRVRRGRERRKS